MASFIGEKQFISMTFAKNIKSHDQNIVRNAEHNFNCTPYEIPDAMIV